MRAPPTHRSPLWSNNAIEMCYTPSSLLPIIQQMYHSTVQFVEVHPLVDKPPPPFKKKLMS